MKFKISYDYIFTEDMEKVYKQTKEKFGTNGANLLLKNLKEKLFTQSPQVVNCNVEFIDTDDNSTN